MSTFEWTAIVLLVLLLFKPAGQPFRLEGTALVLMQQYEMRLVNIEKLLAEIDASTSSTSHDVGAMRIAQLPEYPPDGS